MYACIFLSIKRWCKQNGSDSEMDVVVQQLQSYLETVMVQLVQAIQEMEALRLQLVKASPTANDTNA